MIMTTATAVLATVPASFRGKRRVVGSAEQQLRNIEQQSSCFTAKQLAYGVLYADATGRITGTVSMALRRATAWQAAQLIAAMHKKGLTLISEVASWLNANAMTVLT